jgi:hypothetical protein
VSQPILDLDALRALVDAAHGWKWETAQGDQFGHLNEDGSFYDIGTVDADQYAVGEESHNETILNFIAAFNPQTCRTLIDRLRKAEAAREGWKLVPVELTEEMHVAAVRTIVRCTGNDDFPPRVYRAMLAAAPDSTPTDSADCATDRKS